MYDEHWIINDFTDDKELWRVTRQYQTDRFIIDEQGIQIMHDALHQKVTRQYHIDRFIIDEQGIQIMHDLLHQKDEDQTGSKTISISI